MDLYKYDHFFDELEKQVKSSPENRLKIIRRAIGETSCPYLQSKLEVIFRIYKQ